jgi:hypothetical protein
MLTMLAAGCASAPPAPVADLCGRLAAALDAHAAALADSPHDPSVLTGERLVRLFDAACAAP